MKKEVVTTKQDTEASYSLYHVLWWYFISLFRSC